MTRDEALPRDLDALLALVTRERAEHANERTDLIAKVAELEQQVRVFLRWQFGPRSEKRTIEILPTGARAMQTGKSVSVTIGAPIHVEGRDVSGLLQEVETFLKSHVEGSVS